MTKYITELDTLEIIYNILIICLLIKCDKC